MMKKFFLLSLLLLFVGANSMKAQMDERFNDGKIPYGWYADGWTVKDNAAQKGSSSEGFSMGTLMDGGDSGFTYLLTPPLKVASGENLVFSAKKSKGGGMDSFMGSNDSTFVVERSVYGEHKWIQVADLTTELESEYKTFTISGTDPGEYRFRFRSGGTVLIDSVAGFNIDMEAPDILVIDTLGGHKGEVKEIDFSLCKEDVAKQVLVVNTATGTLVVDNSMSDAEKFSFSKNTMEIAAGDSLDVDIKFNFAAGQPGKNEALVSVKPTDARVLAFEVMAYAIITEPNVWVEDFNGDESPKSWIEEGWHVSKGVATVTAPSGGGMFGGGGSAFYLTTPPLTVDSNTQALLFSVKDGDAGGGMGAMMGGGSSSPTVTVEKSVYGSNKWEKVKVISEMDSLYSNKWVSGFEPGDYRFRFVSADSIVIDSVAGFRIKENAPDLHVFLNGKTTNNVFYGLCGENVKQTFKVYNSGTGPLKLNIQTTDNNMFTAAPVSIDVEASDSTFVDVEFVYGTAPYGECNAVLMFMPESDILQPQYVALKAYKISNEAWSEDFETPYVVEDESEPRELPEGWETTGWQVTKPSGGMMEMFGGGGEPKSWMATTDSKAYELITPRLQAVQGDVLKFDVDIDIDMAGMFGGNSDPAVLFVYYRRDVDKEWTLYNYYAQSQTVYFKAPYSGIYRLKFTGTGSLDNFLGLTAPAEPVELSDEGDNQNTIDEYNDKVVNVAYDRELSAEQDLNGTWKSKAFTICLPYDFNYTAYYPKEQVGVYRLDFVDNFYNEFIFTKTDGNVPAGHACLVVVNEGSISLNAIQARVSNETVGNDVYSYGNDEEPAVVGIWQGTFNSITSEDEKLANAFGMDDDGCWKPIGAGENPISLSSFRAFMKMNEATDKTSYKPMTRQGVSETREYRRALRANGDHNGLKQFPADLYCGDLTGYSSSIETGIIRTVESDGTNRYFDLQGRQLNGKPEKGIYIINGKKFSK